MLIQKAIQLSSTVKPVRSLSFRYFMQEGDRYYQQHQDWAEGENLLDEALNAYSRAQEQAPDEPEVMTRMAKILYLQGHYDKAERYAQKALAKVEQLPAVEQKSLRPVLKEAYSILGALAQQKGQYPKAQEAFLRAVCMGGLQSGEARWELFRTNLACLQSGVALSLPHLLSTPYTLLSALALAPFQTQKHPWLMQLFLTPQLLLAWIQEETGASEKALHRYLDIHHLLPGLASIGNMIGLAYRNKGQFDQARYWFKAVIQRHPTNLDAYCHLAHTYEHQEAYSEMATVYRQVVKLQPSNPHVWCNLANALYYEQSYREALACYETALGLSSDKKWKAMVAQSIANIYVDYIRNTDAALAYYRMAQELDPADAENYIQLGLLYFQKEDNINAEKTYEAACRIVSNNPRLYSNLGYLRWMEGDTDAAIQLYEKAIALDSGYEIPVNNLGVIYMDSLGQIQKAIEHFQEAIEINQNYALAHYNLGRAYSFLNHRLEAAQCFRIAQEINQVSQELDNDELTARINKLFDTYELEMRDSG